MADDCASLVGLAGEGAHGKQCWVWEGQQQQKTTYPGNLEQKAQNTGKMN
jgi:hypothetical protein